MEQIYLHSLPVKEYQIVDFFLPKLKDEVMKVRQKNRQHARTHWESAALESKTRTRGGNKIMMGKRNWEGQGI